MKLALQLKQHAEIFFFQSRLYNCLLFIWEINVLKKALCSLYIALYSRMHKYACTKILDDAVCNISTFDCTCWGFIRSLCPKLIGRVIAHSWPSLSSKRLVMCGKIISSLWLLCDWPSNLVNFDVNKPLCLAVFLLIFKYQQC